MAARVLLRRSLPFVPHAPNRHTNHDLSRVVVIGSTGAGKSTFGSSLATRLGSPFIELDALHWLPGWTPEEPERLRLKVDRATAAPRWVLAGGYSVIRDISWGRATMIVWLDYSFPRILGRLTTRTVRRVITGEELWNGNRETVRKAFFSRDSLFVWLAKTYRRNRRRYSRRLAEEFPDVAVLRFRAPRDADRFLESAGGAE